MSRWPPGERDPLAHAGQAEAGDRDVRIEALRRRRGRRAWISSPRSIDLDLDPLSVRVPGRVRERLLDDAVDGRLDVRIEPRLAESTVVLEPDGRIDLEPVRRLDALDQRIQSGPESELVERRGTQLGDQRPQVRDLLAELLDRAVERRLQRRQVLAAPRGGEHDAQPAEPLQGLVVQLARPAPPLLLGRPQGSPQSVALDRLRGRDGGGGACRGGQQHPLVLDTELGAVSPVERLDHAEVRAAELERHEHSGRRLDAEVAEREAQRVRDVADALGAAGADDPPGDRAALGYAAAA